MSVTPTCSRPPGGLPRLCASMAIVTALTCGCGAAGNPEGARASAPAANPIPVQVSRDRYPIHAEPDVAVNPRNPRNLLAVAQCMRVASPTLAGARIPCSFVTFDGGATWQSNGPLPLRPGDTTGADTTVAFTTRGIAYVAAAVGGQSQDYAIIVWRTDNGGRSFMPPVTVYQPRPGWSADHPWLAVDTAPGPHAGSVYVSWVAGQSAAWDASAQLLFSRSVDGGRSFAAPRPVVRLAHAYPHVPVMAVGPGGVVHVVTYVVDRMQGATETLAVASSADGGRSFGAPRTIGASPALNFPQLPTRNSQAAATDPRDGTLYVAASGYHRDRQHAAILLWRSRDGGRGWAGPTVIGQAPSVGPADAFQPRIAVTPRSTVYVSYFAYAHGRVDVVLAASTTHGAGFSPGQRITQVSFDPFATPFASPWLGDYQGLAVGAGTVHPVWNGTAPGGRMELFTAAIPGD